VNALRIVYNKTDRLALTIRVTQAAAKAMKSPWQRLYIAAVGTAGLLVLFGTFLTPMADPLAFVLFCALVAAAEWTTSTLLEGRISVSIASAVSFAAALIFPPIPAGLVGAIGGTTSAVITARRRKFAPQRALEVLVFNAGMNALATLAGALVFASLHGGSLVAGVTFNDLPPLFVAAVTNDLLNAVALVILIAIQSGQRPLAIWRENFAWAAPINVATMAVGGGALATGFATLGLTGLLVFFLPVFLSAYAFRAYITRTQAVMAHLEETVQARTSDLAAANERLLELHAQKDAFFAVISHDMRSPLTSLMGFAELLERYGNLNDQAHGFVAPIKRNTETLISMVNNILDLSKLDSGKMEYRWEPVNLTTIVQEVLTDMEGHALSRDISVHSQIEPTPQLVGDDEKLRRLVTNLISNALKYTRSGGQVYVEVGNSDANVWLSVRDTGIGIPADQLPHIFERFRRVRRSSGSDAVGTGLGLAIVQEFAQAHGGHIEVHSQEGVGSTFTVSLPVRYQPPQTENKN
jgi:signal transduction histidine kinase